jgi:hypothetical protein
MKIQLIDLPPGAPHPFEPADAQHFVLRTGGPAFSRLFPSDARARDQDFLSLHFPMGQTNLWVLERALLRVGDAVHRWPTPPSRRQGRAEGRFYIYGDDASKVEYHHDRAGEYVLGFSTFEEAEESLGDPALAGASAVVIARLNEDIGWH